MFEQALENIDTLIDKARQSEYLKYDHLKKFYDCILLYCEKNNIIIQNNNILLNKPLHGVNYFKLYCYRTLPHAFSLSDSLSEVSTFIEMRTIIKYKMFIIYVDGIAMVTIRNIPPDIENRLNSTQTYKTYKLNIFKFNLIKVYSDLYNPQTTTYNISETEEQLFSKFLKDNKHIKGGGSKYIYNTPILEWLKGKDNYILLNDVKDSTLKSKLRILGNSTFKEELTNFLYQLTLVRPSVINRKYRELDVMLERHTIFIKDKRVIELYNSLDYESVPYMVVSDLNIASKYVKLKFLMLILWNIFVLDYKNLKKNSSKFMDYIVNEMKSIRNTKDKPLTYVGEVKDVNKYLKKKQLSLSIRTYIPNKKNS